MRGYRHYRWRVASLDVQDDGEEDATTGLVASPASGAPNEQAAAQDTAAKPSGLAKSGLAISDADRRRMQRLAAVPLGFALAAYVGQIFFAALIVRAPLVLLSLNATDAVLLGVARQVPLWAFMAIGVVRLFITDPFLYRLGFDYGPDAKAFLAAELGPRSRVIRAMDWLERWSRKAGWIVLFAIPGYPMCLLSGIARMRRSVFVVANLAGTFARLAAVWWVADVFAGPLGTVINFINRYSIPFTIVMLVLVAVQTIRNQRRTAGTE